VAHHGLDGLIEDRTELRAVDVKGLRAAQRQAKDKDHDD